jgi:hypothetical protein
MGWSYRVNRQPQNTERSTEWKIAHNKMCGKTTDEMQRQHQKGPLVGTEYKRMQEASRGQEHLDMKY